MCAGNGKKWQENGRKMHIFRQNCLRRALDWKCVQNMGYIESLQFACKYVQNIEILEMCGKAVHKL
jgi:hypothetical protein